MIDIVSTEIMPTYVKVRLNPYSKNPSVGELERWCLQTQCGKRINLTSFAFRTDAEYLMFTLRWK